jgi:hypothetical protein
VLVQYLFEPLLDAIPQLTYPHTHYRTNSIHWAAVNSVMAVSKAEVIECTLHETHHTTTGGLQAYLTDSAYNVRAVELAILVSECTAYLFVKKMFNNSKKEK